MEKEERPRVGLGRPEVGPPLAKKRIWRLLFWKLGGAVRSSVCMEVHSLGAVVGEGQECFVNLEVRVREKDRCLM